MRIYLIALSVIAFVFAFAVQKLNAEVASLSAWNLWVEAAPALPAPQTEAEAEEGKRFGRKKPEPELLRPSLDPGLPHFQPASQAELTGHYTAASSDVLPSLVEAWIADFQKYHPKVQIELKQPYAGSLGAKELVKETLDFVFVSRELKPDDLADFNSKFGYDPLSVPVSAGSYRHFGFLDAIGIIVNYKNPISRIDFRQLDAIFSKTMLRGGPAVKTWGDLGLTGEWADKPVHAYGVKPWNGFEEFIRQRVLSTSGKRGEWRDDMNFAKVVFPIDTSVANDEYGIAYDGLAYLNGGVKVLAVSETPGGPFFAPTYEDVARADYPLSRLIYFNINKQPDKPLAPAISEFLRFILSAEGQGIVKEHGIFLPLRAKQAQKAAAAFN
jgi:phosphate transport system substrate-binding protein